MTENDYIWSKLTTWDKVRGHSIWLPLALIVALMIGALYEAPWEYIRPMLVFFLISFMLTIVLRTGLTNKVEKLKNEYAKLK